MGRRGSRQACTPLDKRAWRREATDFCRAKKRNRSDCELFPEPRHWQRRHGDADIEASLSMVAFDDGTMQDWCCGYSCHPHAHQARHSLSQQPCKREGYHLCERRICNISDSRFYGRESFGKGARGSKL